MKVNQIALLFLILLTVTGTTARGSASKRVYFEIRSNTDDAVRAYLVKNSILAVPGNVEDSAILNERGAFVFKFDAAPTERYQIIIGSVRTTEMSFCNGDSAILSLVNYKEEVLFDKEGAMKDYLAFGEEVLDASYTLDDSACFSASYTRDTISSKQQDLIMKAKKYCQIHPEHRYFCDAVNARANNFFLLAWIKRVWAREVFLNKEPCGELPSPDSFDVAYIPDVKVFMEKLLEVGAQRWYLKGFDTLGADNSLIQEQTKLTYQMSGLARDIELHNLSSLLSLQVNTELSYDEASGISHQIDSFAASHSFTPLLRKSIHWLSQGIDSKRSHSRVEDFTVWDINDQPVRLSDFKNKLILLHFWATWCEPCVASLPKTDTLISRHSNDSNFVCLNIAPKSKRWKQFVTDRHLKGYQLYYEDNISINPSHPFGFQWVSALPTYALVDPHGLLITADIHGPNAKLEHMIELAEKNQ